MNSINNQANIIENKQLQKNLKLRFISSIFLVFFILLYLISPIIFNIAAVQQWTKQSQTTYITLTISLILSGALLVFSINELLSSFQIKFSSIKLGIMLFSLVVLWVPFSSYDSLLTSFSFFNNPTINPLIGLLIGIVYLIICSIIYKKHFNKSTNETIKLLLTSFVIIIALKAFNILGFLTLRESQNKHPTSTIVIFGFTSIIWIWLTVILTDVFAYIFGILFGKHKLAPTISPKKSWEGAIAGFICSTLINLIWVLALFFTKQKYAPFIGLGLFNKNLLIIFYVFLTMFISILGQIGDLFFSWIKRGLDIKDFSNLIPGHGGLLDRLDSFYFVLSIIYLILISILSINAI